MTKAPGKLQELRRRIYRKAKSEKTHRFWGLFVHITNIETLEEAYRIAKGNGGAPGIDGQSFSDIESAGRAAFLAAVREDLVTGRYEPMPNRPVEIPKGNGKFRTLQIPCIRDRVVQGASHTGTALDYLIGTYVRSPQRLSACIGILLDAGGVTKYKAPGVLEILRGLRDGLAEQLDADPALVSQRSSELDCGSTGARRLTLQGATLLHVAAEYGNLEAALLLLDRGADVDARATVDETGVGGQTPIFHAVTQFGDRGLAVAELLIERGADLSIRARLPGHYEQPDEIVECTPLGYALRFLGNQVKTLALLRERGAVV